MSTVVFLLKDLSVLFLSVLFVVVPFMALKCQTWNTARGAQEMTTWSPRMQRNTKMWKIFTKTWFRWRFSGVNGGVIMFHLIFPTSLPTVFLQFTAALWWVSGWFMVRMLGYPRRSGFWLDSVVSALLIERHPPLNKATVASTCRLRRTLFQKRKGRAF